MANSPFILSKEQLDYLKSVDSPTLSNAIEPFEIRDRCEGYIGGRVGPLFPDLGIMVGQAVTVTMTNAPGPVAGREGYWRMWEALEAAPKPSVLVIADASGNPSRCAFFGEVMATMATRLGAVGVVTDGGVRDLDEVHALGLHYFAPFPVVSHANFSITDVGSPVTLDGQRISTGDILHGDKNGIVIIPPTILDDLHKEVDKVRSRERATMDLIKSADFDLKAFRTKSGY
jgi:4-hydroxy-4-methyl-2-oxoglutarate aldolase